MGVIDNMEYVTLETQPFTQNKRHRNHAPVYKGVCVQNLDSDDCDRELVKYNQIYSSTRNYGYVTFYSFHYNMLLCEYGGGGVRAASVKLRLGHYNFSLHAIYVCGRFECEESQGFLRSTLSVPAGYGKNPVTAHTVSHTVVAWYSRRRLVTRAIISRKEF